MYFVGHQSDPNLLAGVGLGTMLLNVMCFALSQGLNGGIETFVSQDSGKAFNILRTKLQRKIWKETVVSKDYSAALENLSREDK